MQGQRDGAARKKSTARPAQSGTFRSLRRKKSRESRSSRVSIHVKSIHPQSPIHTTLPQNGRRNRIRNHIPTPHLRNTSLGPMIITHIILITPLLLLLPGIPPQRILRIIETPPPLPSNTIPIKLLPLRPESHQITGRRVTQPPMRQLPPPLHRPIQQEHQHEHRNSSKRTNNTDNRILPALPISRSTRRSK